MFECITETESKITGLKNLSESCQFNIAKETGRDRREDVIVNNRRGNINLD